jgi:predicted O-methyltransferase YrrM
MEAPFHSAYATKSVQADICQTLILKRNVFQAMERLEGWCSLDKASILIDLVLALKPHVVVEIGVFGGKSLVPMAYALKHNQRGKIYGIDPWVASISAEGMTPEHAEWWNSIDHEQIMQTLITRITEFELNDYTQLLRETSKDAKISKKIDLLHIDGNHSAETSYFDVTKWVPLVRSGGIIIFDDLDWDTTVNAVEWLNTHCIKVTEIKSTNIWGIWLKP